MFAGVGDEAGAGTLDNTEVGCHIVFIPLVCFVEICVSPASF